MTADTDRFYEWLMEQDDSWIFKGLEKPVTNWKERLE